MWFSLEQVIALYLLWQVIGPSSLASIGVLILVAPINGGLLVRAYIKYQVRLFHRRH